MNTTTERRRFHSTAYHQYFEGFAERQYFDEKENMHIKRVYIGNYYRRNVTDRCNLALKVVYVALYLLAFLSYIYGGSRDTALSAVKYVFFPVVLSVIFSLWLAFPLFYNLTASREMMIRTYRDGSERLIRASVRAAIMQLINALATAAALVLHDAPAERIQLESIAGFLLSAAAYSAIHFLEKRQDYETLPPRNERPEFSSVIRLRNTN